MLCGPLVAGCGTATRIEFAPRSRPAPPLDVSVYIGGGGLVFSPHAVTAGPVQFYVTNQMRRPQRLVVTAADGRPVTRAVVIPAGGTAQLRATLTLPAYAFRALSRRWPALAVTRPARSGDNAVAQP